MWSRWKVWCMQVPWRKSLEGQMSAGIEREFEVYRRRCEEFHENFLERVKLRDEALEEIAATEEEIERLQGRGVSLLGEMNSAMLQSDERPLKEVRSRNDAFSRELGRAQSKRERLARRLAEIELDEREAARELAQAGQEQIEEARARADSLKAYLDDLLEARLREISDTAERLAGENESRGGREPEDESEQSHAEEPASEDEQPESEEAQGEEDESSGEEPESEER